MSTFSTDTPTTINRYLQVLADLPSQKRRAAHAIIGASVADAATRPFHWVYNRTVLESTVGNQKDIEFWPTSISPFYTIPTGRRSCYNDLGIAMLMSLPEYNKQSEQLYSEESLISTFSGMFSSSSEYAIAMARRKEEYHPSKRLEDRQPVEGPWQQGAVTKFMEDIQAGRYPQGNPESKETDGLCVTIPLIARLSCLTADDDDSRSQVEKDHMILQAAALFSSNATALAHTITAANILQSIIQQQETAAVVVSAKNFQAIVDRLEARKDSLSQVHLPAKIKDEVPLVLNFQEIKEEIERVEAAIPQNYVDVLEQFGKACANPGSFMGACLALLQESSFREVIRSVIRGGGCNCSRSNFAGACAAAAYGIYDDSEGVRVKNSDDDDDEKGIPLSWVKKTDKIEEIICLAYKAVTGQSLSV